MVLFRQAEFGDFQTPSALAAEITRFLSDQGIIPDHIVEPTCGLGSFIHAAHQTFPKVKSVLGYDVNPSYIEQLKLTADSTLKKKSSFECHSFFDVEWKQILAERHGHILVLGNPPWVTNSALSLLESENLPVKANFQRHNGFAAKTGKANFDISEWMMIQLLEALHHRTGWMAMLCKTTTARKVLRYAWKNRLAISNSSIHFIDAYAHFNAAVDACLFVTTTGTPNHPQTAGQYKDLTFTHKISQLGIVDDEMIFDIYAYKQLQWLDGGSHYTWRSGIKHDAASVMEFLVSGPNLVNGNQETCHIETDFLYPLLKSSDIANNRLTPRRYVLVTQENPSDDTKQIAVAAPRTWQYLLAHAATLDQRKSIIYKKRARFSIFGVGDYTFAPWKVAVSGLYKNCRFTVIGQYDGKPIVLDDTCYFIPCQTEEEATFICEMLNSEICQRFLQSLIFFDSKRPITVDVLNRINFVRLAEKLGRYKVMYDFLMPTAEYPQAMMAFEPAGEMNYPAKPKSFFINP